MDTAPALEVDRVTADWPARSKAVARLMIRKYGGPQEATPSMLIWHDNGPWKRTIVNRRGAAHLFPQPHGDVLEQVIDYRVPADKADDLARFDGSLIVRRTAGELAAVGDREEANILAINLAHAIVTGKTSAAQARGIYTRDVAAFLAGARPRGMVALRFTPPRAGTGARDVTTLRGAPHRIVTRDVQQVAGLEALRDPEILAVLFAIHVHEVEIARFVAEHGREPAVRSFARKLVADHGQATGRVLAVAERIDVTPIESGAVLSLRQDSARRLAELAELEGRALDAAFLRGAIEEHVRILALVRNRLLPASSRAELRDELIATERLLTRHLDSAGGLRRGRDDDVRQRRTREAAGAPARADFAHAWGQVVSGAPSASAEPWAVERLDDGAIEVSRLRAPGPAADPADDAAVERRLAANPVIESRDLEVRAEQGVVTLRGTVDARADAAEAVWTALTTPGVDKVLSYLAWSSFRPAE